MKQSFFFLVRVSLILLSVSNSAGDYLLMNKWQLIDKKRITRYSGMDFVGNREVTNDTAKPGPVGRIIHFLDNGKNIYTFSFWACLLGLALKKTTWWKFVQSDAVCRVESESQRGYIYLKVFNLFMLACGGGDSSTKPKISQWGCACFPIF